MKRKLNLWIAILTAIALCAAGIGYASPCPENRELSHSCCVPQQDDGCTCDQDCCVAPGSETPTPTTDSVFHPTLDLSLIPPTEFGIPMPELTGPALGLPPAHPLTPIERRHTPRAPPFF